MSKAKSIGWTTKRKDWSAGTWHKRKPDSRTKIPLVKEPQTDQWLFAALLLFDRIPHNSLANFRELWGILSKKGGKFPNSPRIFSRNGKICLLKYFEVNKCHRARAPPASEILTFQNFRIRRFVKWRSSIT